MLRFTNSGSEAVGTAVRLARAHTGRRILVRFEGHYHGWQDVVYWSNHVDPAAAGPADHPRPVAAGPGVPLELADTLEVLTWNDPESFTRLMDERGDEIAAVITEPAVFNTGCILPEPGYLELLRAETSKHGALLIFDEVITGFRFCRGGGQEWFGVMPDLTTMAKGLGGGFPVAAIGGTREVMGMIAEGRYSHSGTYNANVVQCAAVDATMDMLAEPGLYERQRAVGDRLADGLRGPRRRGRDPRARRGPRHGVPALVHRAPHPQLARGGRVRRRGHVHALVGGDAAARRACSTPASTRTSSSRWSTPTPTSTRPWPKRARCSPSSPPSAPPADGRGPMSLLDARQTPPGSRAAAATGRAATAGKLRYLQVIDLIDAIIAERGLGPGDLLPTQKELASLAGVSLITVRRALDELERSGRVSGHQGVGTFVARPRIVSEPTRSGGLLATLAEQGSPREVTTQVLEVRAARGRGRRWRTRSASRRASPCGRSCACGSSTGSRSSSSRRSSRRRWRPTSAAVASELSGSLYDLLAASHGLVDDHEEQYLEVREAGARERRLLELGARARIVRLRGVSFTAGDVPFDCFEQVYPADEFVFYISGQTARRLFRPADLRDWGVATGQGALTR